MLAALLLFRLMLGIMTPCQPFMATLGGRHFLMNLDDRKRRCLQTDMSA
jgi:hypothetical protein